MTDAPARALLLESIHPDAVEILESAGVEVDAEKGSLDEDELVARIGDYELVGLRSKTHITPQVLDAASKLVAIGAFCIGTNQIDLVGASERGLAVFNAPFSNTRSVVELAISEIIAMTRRLTEKNALMHDGVWDKSASGAHEVRGRTLGIIGYGNIGTQLSVLAESMGMSVVFYDTADRLAVGNARRCLSMKDVLVESDVVTLHVDGRPQNESFFGEDEFATMKPGSLFLNLSRGFVVDYASLRRHIESGHIAGAAVDVFPKEPKVRGGEFESELRGLPNVILTPHIGGSTEEAQEDIGRFVAGKLADFVQNGSTAMSVNVPQLQLPRADGTLRLVHLHRNVPGVLARVNSLLADHGVNVEGQMLGTRGEVGYVVTDSASGTTQAMVDEMRAMPETISLRVIF